MVLKKFDGINCSNNFTNDCAKLEERLNEYKYNLPDKNRILNELALNFSEPSGNDIDKINNISKNVNKLVFDFYNKNAEILLLNNSEVGLIEENESFYFRLVYSQNVLIGLGGNPLWIYYLKGGACQDKSVLTSFLLNYLGFDSKLIVSNGHAWVEIYYKNTCVPIEASLGLGFNSSNNFSITCLNNFKRFLNGLTCYEWIDIGGGLSLKEGCSHP
ncbi:MAG: hypothetical protein WC307_00985 [Candidatus Nanoarchaeia archaeon]|jgi:hypothetical protein